MDYFLLSLGISSFSTSILAILLQRLEEKKILREIKASKKKIIWLVLILNLLFPIKPPIAKPWLELPKTEVRLENQAKNQGNNLENTETSISSRKDISIIDNDIINNNTANNIINNNAANDTINNNTANNTSIKKSSFKHLFFSAKNKILHILFLIWLSAANFLLICCLIKHIKFCRLLKRWGKPVLDNSVLSCLEEIKRKQNYKKEITIVTCPFITGAALTGFIHPKILLPENWSDLKDLPLILTHEITHAIKHDVWITLIVEVVKAFHWFNPIVPKITKELLLCCELTCDEAVLVHTEKEVRIRYGMVLLNAAKSTNKKVPTLFSTQLSEDNRQIKKRIYALKEETIKKNGRFVLFFIVSIMFYSNSVFQIANAEPSGNATIFPFYSLNETDVTIMYSNGTDIIYEKENDNFIIPKDFYIIDKKAKESDLTYRFIEEIYQQEGLDKTKDKIAIRIKNNKTVFINPDEIVPISPTTGGSAKWFIKAYINIRSIWTLNPDRKDIQEIFKISGDALIKIVEQDFIEQASFEQAARKALAEAFQVPEELFILDIILDKTDSPI